MSIFNNDLIIFIAFAGVFFLVWSGIIYLSSFISGWGSLAKHFPDINVGIPGEKKKFQSIKMGISNYSGVITFEVLPQGLRLSVMCLFRIGHKNILIPWEEVIVENMTDFSFKSLSDRHFVVSSKLGGWILENKNKYVA